MPAPSVIRSLVVMGDSFTEGLEDDLDIFGRHLGWADRVAAALAKRSGRVQYANLAVRGRLLDQVVDEQLPVAVAMQPDLATFHAGPTTCCGHAPMSPTCCVATTSPSGR